ncbi:MAG: hypothetical protein AB8F34_02760 [Akkermansiaceae bacterium]
MKKQLLLTPLCGVALAGLTQAAPKQSDLYLFLGGTSSATSVSTSMHSASSAAANYTLGSGSSSSVQTTTGTSSSASSSSSAASYVEDKPDGSSYSSSRPSSGSSRPSSSGAAYSGATSSASGGSSVGSGYHGAKSAKGGIPIDVPQPSPLVFSVSAGYQSDYMYHGLSQITNATFGTTDPTGMYFVGVDAQYKGFSFGLKYVESEGSGLNPRFHPTVTKRDSYSEFVADINYTLGLIAGPQGAGNWLDFTVGYQLLSFSEDTFWNTGEQHEFYGKLSMNRYQWVRPSISYHDITQGDALTSGTTSPGAEILNGDQIIFQIEGSGLLYDAGRAQFGIGYYAQVGFDKGYNTSNSSFKDDWYQYGLNFPIIMDNVTITPSVGYTDRSAGGISDNFWWGLSAKYTF